MTNLKMWSGSSNFLRNVKKKKKPCYSGLVSKTLDIITEKIKSGIKARIYYNDDISSKNTPYKYSFKSLN
jgi:hypothetical protein